MTAGNKLQCPDDPDVDKGIKHGMMDSSSSEAFSLQNHLRSLSVHLLLFCLISFYFHSSYLQHITPPLWALIHLLPTLTPDHSVISTHSPQTSAWPHLSVWPLQTRRNLVTTVSPSSYMSRTSPTSDFLVLFLFLLAVSILLHQHSWSKHHICSARSQHEATLLLTDRRLSLTELQPLVHVFRAWLCIYYSSARLYLKIGTSTLLLHSSLSL